MVLQFLKKSIHFSNAVCIQQNIVMTNICTLNELHFKVKWLNGMLLSSILVHSSLSKVWCFYYPRLECVNMGDELPNHQIWIFSCKTSCLSQIKSVTWYAVRVVACCSLVWIYIYQMMIHMAGLELCWMIYFCIQYANLCEPNTVSITTTTKMTLSQQNERRYFFYAVWIAHTCVLCLV